VVGQKAVEVKAVEVESQKMGGGKNFK